MPPSQLWSVFVQFRFFRGKYMNFCYCFDPALPVAQHLERSSIWHFWQIFDYLQLGELQNLTESSQFWSVFVLFTPNGSFICKIGNLRKRNSAIRKGILQKNWRQIDRSLLRNGPGNEKVAGVQCHSPENPKVKYLLKGRRESERFLIETLLKQESGWDQKILVCYSSGRMPHWRRIKIFVHKFDCKKNLYFSGSKSFYIWKCVFLWNW